MEPYDDTLIQLIQQVLNSEIPAKDTLAALAIQLKTCILENETLKTRLSLAMELIKAKSETIDLLTAVFCRPN